MAVLVVEEEEAEQEVAEVEEVGMEVLEESPHTQDKTEATLLTLSLLLPLAIHTKLAKEEKEEKMEGRTPGAEEEDRVGVVEVEVEQVEQTVEVEVVEEVMILLGLVYSNMEPQVLLMRMAV
jgi:hypothetical protein